MSRRKQGKPQQRKAFNSLDDENDLLVCGFCQRNFLLHDIVKFIHHKVNRCNKENVDVLSCSSGNDRDGERLSNCSDMDDDDESLRDEPFITSKQTSISAPISRKESLDRDIKYSPRLIEPRRELLSSIENTASIKRESTSSIESCSSSEDIKPPPKPQQVDAESNTTNSEPFNHVCDTCKNTFNSAWSLVQHAQNEHQLKIYWSPPPPQTPEVIRTPPKPPSVERRTPHYEHRTPPKEHRTPPCLNLGQFPHPAHHPFLFPMPVPEHPHHTLSPALPHSQFNHPPGHEFGLDSMIRDPFHLRPPLPGITAPFSPAIHSAFEPPRTSLSDPALDFYSTRLKLLARPHSPPPPRPNPFVSTANSSNSLLPPTTSSPKNQVQSPEQIPKGMPTAKLKSCEFCGKCFRFQSNLIVHRRSHTGEKPFKCPLCPHACTQASKLKRHMKTHMNKSPLSSLSHGSNMSNASEGSELSNSSTPDSTKHLKGEDLDEDEGSEDELEDEEEEEEEVFEDELEEEDMEEDSNMDVADEEGPKGRPYYSPGMISHHYPPGMMGHDVPSNHPKDLSMHGGIIMPPNNQSLLNEVMQNTGLNHIQQYHEAFQQALAENNSGAKHRRTPPEANAGRTTPAMNGEQETEKQRSRSADVSPVFLHNEKPHLVGEPVTPRFVGECSPPVHNLIKREPRDSINSLDTLASRSIWFPPTVPPRSLYLPSMALNRDPHFGRVNQTPPDSAFKYIGSSPKPGPSTNCAETNGCAPHRKSLRNDKCEYCGKIFKNCSNLTVHRRSHTGEKPYKCRMCNYACAQSSKLTRHMRTHGRMGKDVYRCKFCSMPFSVPSTLEKHMRKCVDNRHCHPYHEADNDTNGI